MNKQEFLSALKIKLSGLPKQDIEDRLNFYSEMIDDRMEEGLSENAAVLDIGSVNEIAAQIIADIPLTKIVKERIKPKKRFKAWEIVLFALGSPIWLSLLIASIAVIISLYSALWSVIISIWAVFVALVASAFGGAAGGIVFAFVGHPLTGFALIGTSLICAGLAIFLFFGCKVATKGILLLAKKMVLCIKKCLIKKENAHE